MSRSAPQNKIKLLHCQRCTICCTEPIVPVTDADVKRLMKGTSEPASKIVRFYTPSEMEYDRESGLWIRFSYGIRAMGLRKRDDHCRFLVMGDTCEVYEYRPMTCRTFPYQVELDDNDCLVDVKANPAIACQCTQGKDHDNLFQSVIGEICKEDSQDDAYYEKVSVWNARTPAGGVPQFLKFMGLA